uniref:Protein NLP4-like n=1 Tax=Nelumbo nucifera TaxID=4432 RepID=A0A822ZUL6_NELNU|nr:TPA_asm: hypothetical protein HUJ06_016493 [Nelumbo nucifera]
MEDGFFPPNTELGTLSNTPEDFDLSNELLLGGCWLETSGGSDFLQPGWSSTSAALSDSSYFFPTPEISAGSLNPVPPRTDPEETTGSSFLANQPHVETETEDDIRTPNTVISANSSGRAECYPAIGSSKLKKKWWIGPSSNPGPSVRERLIQAVGYIRESTKDRDVLIQIWVPVKRGGKHVLTTDGQPFSLDPNCRRLANYRNASLNYQFPAEENSEETVGLPGRVFLGKVPEWTPDVRFYDSDEYPRIDYAQRCDVRGTVALPVFERTSRTCLGVVEVVMTTQKINYRPEFESVCRALEAVDLRSSEVPMSSHLKVKGQDFSRFFFLVYKSCHILTLSHGGNYLIQVTSNSYQAALPEILEVLRVACETHSLPLAQTWVPCIQQCKGGYRHSDDNYADCVSTMDSACHMGDPLLWGFHEACSEHHFFRGQGVVGKAFTTNQLCFSTDVTTFSKTEYPLLHYARMFGLRAAVAIHLRSTRTETTDYVLEFFLPVDCVDIEKQKVILNSLFIIVQQVRQSLQVITDKELVEETDFLVSEVTTPSNGTSDRKKLSNFRSMESIGSCKEESSEIAYIMESQQKDKSVPVVFQKEEPTVEYKITTNGKMLSEYEQHLRDPGPRYSIDCHGKSSDFGEGTYSSGGRTGEKRRTKTEKIISLQVLQQYFAGSLKDAAKSIGVCPTTLKRICRQHGITRWPSRKIKKVGHSLRKLKVVIDSVQGADGVFQIGSFHLNFSDPTSPNDDPKSLKATSWGAISSLVAPPKSPSTSYTQSSVSSHCISTGIQQHAHAIHLAGSEDISVSEKAGGVLTRSCNDAELHASSQEEIKPLARSHTQKSLCEHPTLENLPPLPRSGSHVSQSVGAIRVKVTYEEDKIRFSLQSTWGFKDLQQEIAERFNIDDTNRIELKYMVNDSKWVLLTCDADLGDCIDIYKSSRSRTIKLFVHQVSHPSMETSLVRSGPS